MPRPQGVRTNARQLAGIQPERQAYAKRKMLCTVFCRTELYPVKPR